ncbi:MAG: hypothetical protein M0Z42_19225 [Actinomycetota bacterium]|nr:hypothetical protein [Actinomycetota bacterium]
MPVCSVTMPTFTGEVLVVDALEDDEVDELQAVAISAIAPSPTASDIQRELLRMFPPPQYL